MCVSWTGTGYLLRSAYDHHIIQNALLRIYGHYLRRNVLRVNVLYTLHRHDISCWLVKLVDQQLQLPLYSRLIHLAHSDFWFMLCVSASLWEVSFLFTPCASVSRNWTCDARTHVNRNYKYKYHFTLLVLWWYFEVSHKFLVHILNVP